MKKKMLYLSGLLFLAGMIGCTSWEKKKAEEASAVPASKIFERPMPPPLLTAPKDQAAYLAIHFWDKFDFRDTMYCHMPNVTEQAFLSFISIFPHTTYDKVCAGVKKLLDSAAVEKVMYDYFFDKAQRFLYNHTSEIRNDEYYIPFLEHAEASPCVSDADKVRVRYQLNLAKKNRPGEKALDFTYVLTSGKVSHLHEVAAPYTLLLFYDPDCAVCRHTTEMLKSSSIITDAISSGKLKVLAVYPDENLDAWKKRLADIPTTWINGYDKSLEVKTYELYDIKARPTLYLLDKDKKVILKDTSVGHIDEYLKDSTPNS
jgi:peroxiredoxin